MFYECILGYKNKAYTKVDGVRSKVECATLCYADKACRTAVFETDGNCFLIESLYENLPSSVPQQYQPLQSIIELKHIPVSLKTIQKYSLLCHIKKFQYKYPCL